MASDETFHRLQRPEFDKPFKVLIVVAPYFKTVTDALRDGAVAEIEAAGGSYDIVEVPGALEVPTAIGIAERMSNFDAYVGLGCVIRGETQACDAICNDSSRALTLLGLQGLCIGNGILNAQSMAQAHAYADVAGDNKGGGAAAAALHLLALVRKWGGPRKGVGFVPARDEYQIAGKGPNIA